ncbi:MAG TPA: SAM-dependent methyltransferase, partial [Micromonosporaceae bacterium]
MASNPALKTAFGAAMFKAFEQHVSPDVRLYDDRIGPRLLTGMPATIMRFSALRAPMRALMERMEPGLIGAMACRTRAIDDAVAAAVADGAQQAVILGAGLDTRAQRLPEFAGLPVWELDALQVQAAKVASVTRLLGEIPPQVRYLPVDFADQSIADVLDR